MLWIRAFHDQSNPRDNSKRKSCTNTANVNSIKRLIISDAKTFFLGPRKIIHWALHQKRMIDWRKKINLFFDIFIRIIISERKNENEWMKKKKRKLECSWIRKGQRKKVWEKKKEKNKADRRRTDAARKHLYKYLRVNSFSKLPHFDFEIKALSLLHLLCLLCFSLFSSFF